MSEVVFAGNHLIAAAVGGVLLGYGVGWWVNRLWYSFKLDKK